VKGLACANMICVQPGGAGDACNLPAQPCRADLYCSSAKASGTCMARVGTGASCANNGDACDYSQGDLCNTLANPNVCVTINIAQPGNACGLGSKTLCVGGVAPCSSILLGGVCANPAQDGATCGGNAVCIPPATCVNKLCRLPSVPNCQ
jgi:hypothetical protein